MFCLFSRDMEGLDEDGMLVHSSMYRNLVTNNPKFFLECPDFLFDIEKTLYDHLNQSAPRDYTQSGDLDGQKSRGLQTEQLDQSCGFDCFPSSNFVLKYLNDITNHFSLKDCIRFKCWVDWVSYDERAEKFQVTVSDLNDDNKRKFLEQFDYVIIASGHYTQPNYVSYPGEETFPGTVIHAKFFMDADRYKGAQNSFFLILTNTYCFSYCNQSNQQTTDRFWHQQFIV